MAVTLTMDALRARPPAAFRPADASAALFNASAVSPPRPSRKLSGGETGGLVETESAGGCGCGMRAGVAPDEVAARGRTVGGELGPASAEDEPSGGELARPAVVERVPW